jgi:hypothetical protein
MLTIERGEIIAHCGHRHRCDCGLIATEDALALHLVEWVDEWGFVPAGMLTAGQDPW